MIRRWKSDWQKIVEVIRSINDLRQIPCAQKIINNYKRMYGLECDHKLLELEVRYKTLKLQKK